MSSTSSAPGKPRGSNASGLDAVVLPFPIGGPHEPPCRGQQVVFFAGDRSSIDLAKRICGDCPVRVSCLDEALAWPPAYQDGTGVWGGTAPVDRRALRRARRHGDHVA